MSAPKIILEELRDSVSLEDWLKVIAETCIEHMKYIELMEDEHPEGLTVDDYGLLELERAYLTLYALHTKGAIPSNDPETKPH